MASVNFLARCGIRSERSWRGGSCSSGRCALWVPYALQRIVWPMSKRSDTPYTIGILLLFFILLPAGCAWIEHGTAPFKREWLNWFGISGDMTVAEYHRIATSTLRFTGQ